MATGTHQRRNSIRRSRSINRSRIKIEDGLKNNILFALLWAKRFDELKERTKERAPDGFFLAAIAASSGASAALSEASSRIPTVQARQTAIASAAQLLINLKFYKEAAEIFDAVSAGTDGAAAGRALSEALRAATRFNPNEHTPESSLKVVLQRLISSQYGPPDEFFSSAYRPRAPFIAAQFRSGFGQQGAQHVKAGFPLQAAGDIVAGLMEGGKDGDDAGGYRINVSLGTNHFSAYLILQEGAYKLRSLDDATAIGEEAMTRLDKGDLTGAKRWLDWVRNQEQLTGGEDPLSGAAFPRLWSKNASPDPNAMRVAAASLTARVDDSTKSLEFLKAARARAKTGDDAERVDLAIAEAETRLGNGGELLSLAESASQPGPCFSKQTDCSRSETSTMDRSARVLPQGPRGDNIGGVCHSEKSLSLGLPACDVPMFVHSRSKQAAFHDGTAGGESENSPIIHYW